MGVATNERTSVKLLSNTLSETLVKGDNGKMTLKPNGKLFGRQITNQMQDAKHFFKYSEIHTFYLP